MLMAQILISLLRLCKEAGFTLKRDDPDLLPYQEFLVFEKP